MIQTDIMLAMNIRKNLSIFVVAPVFLLLVVPAAHAAEGNPSADGLQKLVAEVGAITEKPALGDTAKAVGKIRDEAAAAIENGRLHVALDKIVQALEIAPGLIYRATMSETITDHAAFEAEWRRQSGLASESKREAAAASCTQAPAHVRALTERALNRSIHYYEAALAMEEVTTPENGLAYLGRAQSQLDLQRICESLATKNSLESPPVHALIDELESIELRTAEAFAKPDAGIEKHNQFIVLNAAIKELLELNQSGLYHGALYQYLDATQKVGMLSGEVPEDREALLKKATAYTRRFEVDGIDHGIVLAFLESAVADLENNTLETAELTRAAVIVEEVAPAYAAVVGTTAKRPQPKVAADQVAITLVRWPYT